MQQLTFFVLALIHFRLVASVKPLGSQSPVTRTRIQYIDVEGDYDYEETTTPRSKDPEGPKATTPQFTPRECDYDPCTVPAVPCSVTSALTKCYCPGITSADELPTAPRLKELKQGALGEVEVHWCAPQSTVTHYKVVTEGGSYNSLVFNESLRSGTVHGLKVGSRVCVVAVNNAGFSTESETSCARFEPHESNRVALISGVAAGGVGFLVLILGAGLLLWRCRNRRKNGTVDGEGLGNPSYSMNETL